MILKPGNPWGRIRGKVSLNPEQALKMWGFIMDPTAKGVIFREYTYLDDNLKKHRGTFISNYFPPSNPQTEPQQANREKMRNAVIHWQSLDQGRKNFYNREASRRHLQMSGFNYHNRLHMLGRI